MNNRREFLQLMFVGAASLALPANAIGKTGSPPAGTGAQTMTKILMITTSAARMPGGEPTGVWLEELTTPYYD